MQWEGRKKKENSQLLCVERRHTASSVLYCPDSLSQYSKTEEKAFQAVL